MTKVTPEQRQELIDIYVKDGWAVSSKACLKLGLGKNYAFESWKEAQNPERGLARDRFDPRWQWAIERGPISWP